MSDNINVTPGIGSTVAADDIGGVLHQRVKVVIGNDGTSDGDISSSNPLPIEASSLPLPTGAATETTLASIDTKVTTTVNGIKVDSSGTTQPISAVSLPLPTGAATQATLASIDSNVIKADTDNVTITSSVLPSGASTETTLSTLNTKFTTTVNGLKVDGSAVTQPVSGPLTDTQLRASAVSVTGPLTDTQLRASAVPVSASSLPLPTGAATALKQDTGNTSLSSIDSKTPALVSGRQPVDGSGVTQPISAASLPLPSGAATETTLASIDTKVTTTINGIKVDGSSVTQPVSASTLPLPSGASTSALQTSGNSSLSSIDSKTPSLGQALSAASVPVVLTAAQLSTLTPLSTVAVTQSTSPWVVSGTVTANNPSVGTNAAATPTSSTLIGGAVTTVAPSYTTGQLNALSLNTSGGLRVDGSAVTQPISASSLPLPTGAATESTLSALNTKIVITGNGVKVDGSAVTQPVSGPLTDTQLRASAVPVSGPLTDTQLRASAVPISASTLPLPTGAATQATLSSIDTKVPSGLTVKAASTPAVAADQALVVTLSPNNPIVVSSITGSVEISNDAGNPIPVNGTVTANAGTGTFAVSASSLPLPSGAATSALQTTGNSSLSSIDSKVPSLGQAVAASSVPVVLTAAQISTLTPLSTVAVTQSTSPWVVSGTVTAANPSVGTAGVAPPSSNTLIGGAVTTVAPSYTTGQLNALSLNTSGGLRVDGSAVTQPISASSLPLPTGAATETTLSALNTKVTAVNTGAVTISTALPTGTNSIGQVTANAGTNLNTSALNLEATQSAMSAKLPNTLGQKTMANSMAVAISSDQSSIPVTGTFFQATQPVSIAASVAVTGPLTDTQLRASAVPISAASLPLPSGAATETTLAKLPLTQGSTTSGQSGVLEQAAVTTAAPSYTTGQTSPLSLNTSGYLRTTLDSSGSTGSAVPATGALVAGSDGTNLRAIKTDTSGNQIVVGNVASAATDSGNPIKVGGVYNTTLLALTAGQRGDIQLATQGQLITTRTDGYKATYSAAISGLAMAATPTDVFTITGSATKTIRILRIFITGTQTTAATRDILIIKRSTANSAGTSTTQTNIPHDSNEAAATATIRAYTANPTLGTTVGNIRSDKLILLSPTSANNGQYGSDTSKEYEFGESAGQAIVLRGTSQVLAINFNSVTSTGNSMNFYIEWTEE